MIALQRSRILTMFLILTVLSSITLRTFPASAQPNYSPGVKPGDSITYGEFSINGTTPYPPFPPNTTSLKLTVQTVNSQTNNVNASLVYTFKNGTQSTQNLSGNTVTGEGNLFPYLVAANLTAGDLLFNSPYPYYPYLFNATVGRVYAGALRSVNVFNITLTNPGQSVQALFYWDVQTGFLLDAAETVNYPGQSFSIRFKATDTNVWTPNTGPDYSLDASTLSSAVIHRGESTSFRLDLTSLNGFADTINLTSSVPTFRTTQPFSTIQPPSITLNPNSVSLPADSTANALVTVSANFTTTLGQYVISVNATTSSINHRAELLVVLAPPDFIVDANPGNLTIPQGTSKNSTLTITGRGGFTGTVTLLLQPPSPFGTLVTASLSLTVVTLNSTVASATSTLTVSAGNSQPGTTAIYITANSGDIYQNIYIPVNVTGPDFRITASPTSLSLKQGGTGQAVITLTSILGFTGPVNLSTNSFGGIFNSLSNNVVNLPATGQANSTLTVSASITTPPGFYYASVTGTSGSGINHSVYVAVNVTGPDFRLTSSGYFFSVDSGKSVNSTLTLSSVGGFSGAVLLSVSTFGPVVATVSPSSVTLNSNLTATAMLSINTLLAPPSSFANVDVRATSGNLVHDVYISISITGPDFSISANPTFLSIPQGGSGQSTLSLTSIDNFTGPVTLSSSSSLTTSFSNNPVSLSAGGSAYTTLTIQAPLNTPPGNYFVGIIATSGALVRYSQVYVFVVGPDFSLTASPSYLTIPQGGTASSTIYATSIDNLQGTISISSLFSYPITVSPGNTTLTLSSNSTVATTFQFSAGPGVAPGIYNTVITGSLGSVSHSTSITVQVTGPDFTFFAIPGSLQLKPGQTGVSTLYLSSLEGFNGNVSLTVFSYGLNATLANTTLALSSGGSNSSTITIQAPENASPNLYYYVAVQASSGTIIHTTQIYVQIIAPDFNIFSNPSQLFIQAGNSAQSTLQLTSINGFNGTVTLSAFPGIFSNFTQPVISPTLSASNVTLTPGGSAFVILNITTGAAAAGNSYFIQVEATSANLTHYTSVFVTVSGPSFQLSADPDFLTIPQGGSGNITITASSINGFSGNVSLTAAFPFGISGSITPQNFTLSSEGPVLSLLNVTAAPTTAPGFYGIYVTGVGGTVTRNVAIQVQVTGAAFSLSVSPSFVSFPQGGSAGANVVANSVNGFSGNVTLSVFSRFGIYASLAPQNVTLTPGSSALSMLNVTAPTTTAPGFYSVIITGTSGAMTQTTFFQVEVIGPAFSLSANPAFLTLNPGTTGNSTITLTKPIGFNGTITLMERSFPGGLITNLNPHTLVLDSNMTSASSLLTVTAPNGTPSGLYIIAIGAEANSFLANTTVYVQVTGSDFTLFTTPPSITVSQGGSASTTLIVSGISGFNGLVNFTAYSFGPGPGLQESFTPLNVTLSPSTQNATLTMTVSASLDTLPGSYNVTVVGISYPSGGFIAHTASVEVTIIARPDFTVAVSPTFVSVVQGSNASFTISMASNNQFSGNVSLTALLTPPGPSANFSSSTVFIAEGSSAISTLTIAAGSSPVGYYNVTIQAVAGSLSHQVVVNIYVAPKPDFSLATSSTGLIIVSGASGTSTVSVSPMNGFVAPVSLSANGPAGFTTSYSINPIPGGSGTSILTVSVASSVATGSYIVTVTGASGPITHTATVNVTVSASTKTTLVLSQVSWAHRLSLAKNGNTQTFTLILKNTGKSATYVQLLAAGNSTDLKTFFNLESAVAMLPPGSAITISLSQPFNTTNVGLKFNFTIQLFYGTSIDSSGNILSPQMLQAVKGSFTIVP